MLLHTSSRHISACTPFCNLVVTATTITPAPHFNVLLQAPGGLRAAPALSRGAAQAPQATPKKVLMMGGTRFIGLYLARQLVEAGHEVTLFTRGKADTCPQIPDDTEESYKNFSQCDPLHF